MTKTLNIQEIFDIWITKWRACDPRWEAEVQKYLAQLKKEYDLLSPEEKSVYNPEHLEHPYHDSTIYYGKPETQVARLIVGIDVEGPEFLLVHELNKNPEKAIDLVVWHHPEWSALLWIAKLQKGIAPAIWLKAWVPINVCEKVEFPRVWEVAQRFSPMNHSRALSFPKMLDIPYMWIHTPADNCCQAYFEEIVEKNEKKLECLQDIIDLLMKEPEMQEAARLWCGPQIWNGEKSSRCWKIAVTGITWGTEGSKDIYAEYAAAGVGTILEMHMSAEHLKEAKKHRLNVIMTDHMASDSLWMNLIFDEVEKQWVEVLAFSGFTRYSRNR